MMILNLLIGTMFAASPSRALELSVVDVGIARKAASRSPVYLQSGQALKPDRIDFAKPYCHTFAHHVSITEAKTYDVLQISTGQVEDSTTHFIRLKLAPNTRDPVANFTITCFAPDQREAELNDARKGLSGVYSLY